MDITRQQYTKKPPNTQARSVNNSQEIGFHGSLATRPSKAPSSDRVANELLEWALHYGDNFQISVIPVPHGAKYPEGLIAWGSFMTSKLHRIESNYGRAKLSDFYYYAAKIHKNGCGLAAICGLASDGLFTIDCDSAAALDGVLSTLQPLLEEMGKPEAPVFRRAGRGGQILLKAKHGAVESIGKEILGDIEILGASIDKNGNYSAKLAVLPPTGHTEGARLWDKEYWQIPELDEKELKQIFLQDTEGKRVSLKLIGKKRDLNTNTKEYLESGHQVPEGFRNSALWPSAVDFRNNGYTEAEARAALVHIAVESGYPEKEALAVIKSIYKHERKTPKARLTEQQKLTAYIASLEWRGRNGATDRAVIEFLLERRQYDAHNRQNQAFRASNREIMIGARIGTRKSLKNVMARLIARQLIERSGNVGDKPRGASLWRFTDSAMAEAKNYRGEAAASPSTPTAFVGQAHEGGNTFSDNVKVSKEYPLDATHHTSIYWVSFGHSEADSILSETSALGKRGYSIFRGIKAAPHGLTAEEIAQAEGMGKSGVYKHLRRMAELELVEKQGERYLSKAKTKTDTVRLVTGAAQDKQKSGKSAISQGLAREQRYQEEQALFPLQSALRRVLFLYEQAQQAEKQQKEAEYLAKTPLGRAAHEIEFEAMLQDFANETGAEITTLATWQELRE